MRKILNLAIKTGSNKIGMDRAPSILNKYFDLDINKQKKIIDYKNAHFEALFSYQDKKKLINLGGDHSISISTISAFKKYYPNGGVLWLDRYPNISNKGSLNNKVLSYLSYNDLDKQDEFDFLKNQIEILPQELYYIGLESADNYEYTFIKKNNILYSSFDVRELLYWSYNFNDIHISLDINVLKNDFINNNNKNGLSINNIKNIFSILSDKTKSIDIVEYNPLTMNDDISKNTMKEIIHHINKIIP